MSIQPAGPCRSGRGSADRRGGEAGYIPGNPFESAIAPELFAHLLQALLLHHHLNAKAFEHHGSHQAAHHKGNQCFNQ
jgi:hypothetical protein